MKKTVLLLGLVLLVFALAGCTNAYPPNNSAAPPASSGENGYAPAAGPSGSASGLSDAEVEDLGTGTGEMDEGLQDLNPSS